MNKLKILKEYANNSKHCKGFDKIKIFYYCTKNHSSKFLPIKMTNQIKKVKLTDGKTYWFRDNWADTKVLSNYYTPDYEFKHLKNIKVIFDVGSNVGIVSKYLYKLFPKAEYYLFEPLKENFLISSLNCPFATVEKIALSDKNGFENFFVDNENIMASKIPYTYKQTIEKIRTIPAKDYVKLHGIKQIDLLKIDTEGSEIAILKGFKNLKNIKYIIAEVHSDLWLKQYLDLTKNDFNSDIIKQHNNLYIVYSKNKEIK